MSFNLPNSLPKAEIRCNICTQRKSTQRNSLSKSDRIEKKLEIITADIIGPFEVDTFNKGRFTLTICDIATSFSEKVLASKDQAEQLLVDTIQRWECQTGCLVKSVGTDNGGEFFSSCLLSFFLAQGIKAKRALPYHHYQNGVIEHFNQTLQDMGHTILIDSRLGKQLWGFTFIWACNILNLVPNSCSSPVTPYEAFRGTKPLFDHPNFFGQ